jgi:predicted peptidase
MNTSAFRMIGLSVLIIIGIGISPVRAQSSRFAAASFTGSKGDTLKYRIMNPDYNPSRKYPLIIFLHGSGERGNDNEAQLKWGVMNFATDQMMSMHPAIVVAPQCPEKLGWSNFNDRNDPKALRMMSTPSKPMELVIQLIGKLTKEMPVDPSRIYITGLSMGGFGTFDAIARYPDLFAAAVPVCGGGDISTAAAIVHIPIWIFHGAEDAAVNPEFSMKMAAALTEAGGHPGFTQYPESGHFSWLAAYSDPQMIEWLFRQRKEGK